MLPLKFRIMKNDPVILLKKLCTLITYVTLLPFFGEKCRINALLCIINEKFLCYFYTDIYF